MLLCYASMQLQLQLQAQLCYSLPFCIAWSVACMSATLWRCEKSLQCMRFSPKERIRLLGTVF